MTGPRSISQIHVQGETRNNFYLQDQVSFIQVYDIPPFSLSLMCNQLIYFLNFMSLINSCSLPFCPLAFQVIAIYTAQSSPENDLTHPDLDQLTLPHHDFA